MKMSVALAAMAVVMVAVMVTVVVVAVVLAAPLVPMPPLLMAAINPLWQWIPLSA